MSSSMLNLRNAVLLGIIILVAVLRIASFAGIGPLTLFSPMGAMALFGAAYFKGNIKPYLFPLLTLFISDVFVSFTIMSEFRSGLLYSGWEWTYLAFAFIVAAGTLIIRKVTFGNVVTAVLAATLIHWLISNIGMCIQSNVFSFPLYGQKLASALPFELRFMAGTAVYCVLMFGFFEILQKKYAGLRTAAF